MFNWICATAGRAAILGLIVGLGIGGAVGFGLGVIFSDFSRGSGS